MSVNFHKAVYALYPNARTVDYATETKPATVKDAEGNLIVIDMDAINAWVDPEQYKYDRETAYPSIAEQLDMQYHDKINGTTTWADAIQAVKDKYPKPESN
jgi:hypothetical protein